MLQTRFVKLFRRTFWALCSGCQALTGVFLDIWPVAAELIPLGPSRASFGSAPREKRSGAAWTSPPPHVMLHVCRSGWFSCLRSPLCRPVVACPSDAWRTADPLSQPSNRLQPSITVWRWCSVFSNSSLSSAFVFSLHSRRSRRS